MKIKNMNELIEIEYVDGIVKKNIVIEKKTLIESIKKNILKEANRNDYNYDGTPVGISENGKKMCRKK